MLPSILLVLVLSAVQATCLPVVSDGRLDLLKRSRIPSNPFTACCGRSREHSRSSNHPETLSETTESSYQETSEDELEEDMRQCRENITGSLGRLDTILNDINALLNTPTFCAEEGHPLTARVESQVSLTIKLVKDIISGTEMHLPLYLDDPESRRLKEDYEASIAEIRGIVQRHRIIRPNVNLHQSMPAEDWVTVQMHARRANKAVDLLRDRYDELCQEFYGASTST